ncbi:MAG: glycoside hydrolase family 3 C-terminal domain-containing protein, partial [Oscillospiraceae bacterium]|nr:glycoside hydrolase family 3 C-terminal domain-containing protein [Oscillospiraceae bacterium]
MELFPYEKEHLSRLRPSLAECMVLLKTNGAFPLDTPSSLAAYGSGVRCSVKGGTGSGEVNSRFSVTIEQGLKEAGFTLTSGAWLDAYDSVRAKAKESFRKALREEARAAGSNLYTYGMGAVMPEPEYDLPVLRCADAAIYVLSRISGEGNDRKPIPGDVLLTNAEIRDIHRLNSLYDRFMLVLNVGGPVDLMPVMEVGNILLISQLGTEMGSALADVLLGKLNPSGKLS